MKLTDKRFWIFESIVLICTNLHLHLHIMDETLVGAVWFSILWILLPYAFWRSGGMETIQRQSMVEIG